MGLIDVKTLAKIFRVSPRQVQKFAYVGMPRQAHGQYDPLLCMAWYIRFLHHKVCGCSGPCEGFASHFREMVNARAERKAALREAVEIAPELVGLDAEAMRQRLKDIVRDTYDAIEFVNEKES